MIELELLGIGADGESLVFTDPSGERYTTPITDELRGALRRERPQLDVAPEPAATLKPSQIQTLLRAGLTAVEVASEHNVDLGLVQRFEPPIQAEKEYVLRRAQDARVGGEPDGPRLSELVVDRLATRGVLPTSIMWFARREVDSPWEVSVSFVQGAAEYAAHWHFDQGSSSLTAIDQEAQWLTETASNAPLHTIFPPVSQIVREDADAQSISADAAQREALVDQLNAARGKRVDIDVDGEDRVEGEDADPFSAFLAMDSQHEAPAAPPSISARIYSLAQAKTKREDATASVSPDVAPANAASSSATHGTQARDQGATPASDSPKGSALPQGAGSSPTSSSPSSSSQGTSSSASGARAIASAQAGGSAQENSSGRPSTGTSLGSPGSASGAPRTDDVPSGKAGSGVMSSSGTASGRLGKDSAAASSSAPPSAATLPGLDGLPSQEPAPREKKRTKRRSVPSWDEIVFGSKP